MKINNKPYLKKLNRLILGMIKMGHIGEAVVLGKFVENRDKNTIQTLSKRFKRIFDENDLIEIERIIKAVTSSYVREYDKRGYSEAHKGEFISKPHNNIIRFDNRHRS